MTVIKTYQQNFISTNAGDDFTFNFAQIPHKAKRTNRFKVSLSALSSYKTALTTSTILYPQLFWIKGLNGLVSNTSSGATITSQVSQDTLLGIVGNGTDVGTIVASYAITANTNYYTPFYFYLDEMPTSPFNIYYTSIDTSIYMSAIPDLYFIVSFLIEEEDNIV